MNGRNSVAGCWLHIWFQVKRKSNKPSKKGWGARGRQWEEHKGPRGWSVFSTTESSGAIYYITAACAPTNPHFPLRWPSRRLLLPLCWLSGDTDRLFPWESAEAAHLTQSDKKISSCLGISPPLILQSFCMLVSRWGVYVLYKTLIVKRWSLPSVLPKKLADSKRTWWGGVVRWGLLGPVIHAREPSEGCPCLTMFSFQSLCCLSKPGASRQRSPTEAIYQTLACCFRAGRATARFYEVTKSWHLVILND